MQLTEPDKKDALFDIGYRHGILWGEEVSTKRPKNSWAAKSQYIAGVRLGQQEHRKRKLQQLIMLSPT